MEDQKYDLEYVVKRKDVEVHTYKNILLIIFFVFEKSISANKKYHIFLALNCAESKIIENNSNKHIFFARL